MVQRMSCCRSMKRDETEDDIRNDVANLKGECKAIEARFPELEADVAAAQKELDMVIKLAEDEYRIQQEWYAEHPDAPRRMDGRPYICADGPRTATALASPGWSGSAQQMAADGLNAVAPEARKLIANEWTKMGLAEHASVA